MEKLLIVQLPGEFVVFGITEEKIWFRGTIFECEKYIELFENKKLIPDYPIK